MWVRRLKIRAHYPEAPIPFAKRRFHHPTGKIPSDTHHSRRPATTRRPFLRRRLAARIFSAFRSCFICLSFGVPCPSYLWYASKQITMDEHGLTHSRFGIRNESTHLISLPSPSVKSTTRASRLLIGLAPGTANVFPLRLEKPSGMPSSDKLSSS